MRKKAKQAGGKRRGRPSLSSGNRQGDPGPEVFPESKAGEERNPQRAYNLRGTPARKRARSEVQISLQEPSSDLTPREDEWGEEQADEEILLPADSQDQPLPDERGGSTFEATTIEGSHTPSGRCFVVVVVCLFYRVDSHTCEGERALRRIGYQAFTPD